MIDNIIKKIKKELIESVNSSSPSVLLFSGGLDSSILASIYPEVTSVTVCFNHEGEDKHFSRIVNEYLNLKNHFKIVEIDEAIESIPEVIKILKTFDPAIPNDITAFLGIKLIKSLGFKDVMTGDGSDEIFAGYDYMRDLKDLDQYIRKISKKMIFSSNEFCDHFKLRIIQPYLNTKLINLALEIPVKYKINKYKDLLYGKWILRKAFEGTLPDNIIWQNKRPLEVGSGMTKIREIISSRVDDSEYIDAQKTIPVKFINKEHYYYYRIFMDVIGEIPKPNENEKICPGCCTGLIQTAIHCKTCGYVLNWRN
jgi:asparagine synthase (glutamine-hydrolysing)